MNDDEERVIVVDADDRETGAAPKIQAHRNGLRHRAISVFIRDGEGRFLIQKRHSGKYHSGGLWANACCSHPRPGEAADAAARRRLEEEMGITCPLSFLFCTRYEAAVGNGLTENEVVHVYGGIYSGPVSPDPDEADDTAWVDFTALQQDVARQPQRYSAWLRHYITHHAAQLARF